MKAYKQQVGKKGNVTVTQTNKHFEIWTFSRTAARRPKLIQSIINLEYSIQYWKKRRRNFDFKNLTLLNGKEKENWNEKIFKHK